MKAVVAVLFAALAVAHAGLIAAPAVAGQYQALTLGGAPIAITANAASLAAPLAYAAPAAVAAPVAYAAPAAVAAPLAAPVVAAPVVAAPVVGAGYTAVTRGAVHSAPLPGHAIGSAHVNVQPAPGTL
ncbi:hypothetical protein R5R35_009311 [Gryllus longicercus]|uniref:Accessory gland protein n=1 Tax=Gryllus longicercus TaxID=2509291 RepID=A0AAN9W061_9ORTH